MTNIVIKSVGGGLLHIIPFKLYTAHKARQIQRNPATKNKIPNGFRVEAIACGWFSGLVSDEGIRARSKKDEERRDRMTPNRH